MTSAQSVDPNDSLATLGSSHMHHLHRFRRVKSVEQNVLFDEPGPRARKRIALFNVIGVALVLVLLVWIRQSADG